MSQLERIARIVKRGYNSIPCNIPVKKINSGEYKFKNKIYKPLEFAFQFPSWYDNEDLFKIGVAFKKLKIANTYTIQGSFAFDGEMLPIEDIFKKFYFNSIYNKPNPKCKYILERIPLEINRDSGYLGRYSVYERYGIIK